MTVSTAPPPAPDRSRRGTGRRRTWPRGGGSTSPIVCLARRSPSQAAWRWAS